MAQEVKSKGRIVFLTAWPGVGKTTTGDYLKCYCNFHHVDGDLFVAKAGKEDWTKAYADYWLKDCDAPAELWQLAYQQLCDSCLAAADEHDEIVISHMVYRREVRDFFRARLGGRGLIFLKLECDVDVVVKGLEKRTEDFVRSQMGKTMEDYWNGPQAHLGVCFREKYGEYSYENFKIMQLETTLKVQQPFADDERDAISVDVSTRDSSCFDRVNAALRLPLRTADVDMGMLDEISKSTWEQYK
eukprot:TRINITY_DN70800_c0_g1_i1.p1 TRINITY_DN70800_c0_g1~~TRINITY_DN70800_c0_g1_i1.p1  ORF type:complete len:264 (-),score=46.30 TRINITY_DN70800_c0_g1_i1:294-1025(-)